MPVLAHRVEADDILYLACFVGLLLDFLPFFVLFDVLLAGVLLIPLDFLLLLFPFDLLLELLGACSLFLHEIVHSFVVSLLKEAGLIFQFDGQVRTQFWYIIIMHARLSYAFVHD